MTTEQINSQRLDTVRDPVARLLIELTRRFVLPQKRIATIAPPADFAEAVAEALVPGRVPTVKMPDDVEDEHIGREISERPFLW